GSRGPGNNEARTSRGAALVSGRYRKRPDSSRPRIRAGADAVPPGPLRCRILSRISRVDKTRKRTVLPTFRLHRHPRNRAAARWSDIVGHVAATAVTLGPG